MLFLLGQIKIPQTIFLNNNLGQDNHTAFLPALAEFQTFTPLQAI